MTTSEEIPPIRALLGEQIRLAREDVGMTQADLAGKVFCTPQMVSAMELGRRAPKRPMIRAIEDQLGTGTRLTSIWRRMVKESGIARIARLVELEAEASMIRIFEPAWVPGLLQTESYARAIMAGGVHAGLAEEVISEQVDARLARQEILTRENPPNLWVVVDEAVLHRIVGGAAIVREQLGRLLILIEEYRHVRIQVLPYSEGAHLPAGPMTILDSAEGRAVYQDGAGGGQLIADPHTIAESDEWFDVLRSQAASLTESARMIRIRMEES